MRQRGKRSQTYVSYIASAPLPPILAPSCPSGGIGRRSGLRPSKLSPRGEIPRVKPVKVGGGPEAQRFELMPSQALEIPGKV